MKKKCDWCIGSNLYEEYHDNEWGIPIHNEKLLFEFLILETQQAGLSWITVLKKREYYRKALDNFDYVKIAKYDEKNFEELMQNENLIRNKLKIFSIIKNAKAFLEIQKEFGSFDKYIWSFTNNIQIKNHWKFLSEIPNKTKLSDKISKDLKKRGFSFVGSITIYAYMQAIGIIDDHLIYCFKYSAF